MSDLIILHGFPVSPHVRAARMAFLEKNVAIEFKDIGFGDLGSEEYGRINPFRKMPALTHGELVFYETPALLVYADAIGSGPRLEPSHPAERARMWQFVGIAQSYLFPVGVMQLYFHNVLAGLFGMDSNQVLAQSAVGPTASHLDVLEAALGRGYLAGEALSIADLYCGSMVDYIARTRDGRSLVDARPRLLGWLETLRGRESFTATLASMLAGSDQA